ncbi:MAG: PadR family transcriptional regulator [Clostridiales bacterium]|jgi:DNA-binding PadR family transcriptional regulator|nr:PadR family transcriptional regulator [Clostridiales bacterium]
MRDHIGGGALTETTFLVLLSMFSPNHGYGIMQFIERETGGRVLLGAGTLYGAINAALKKKWIEPIAGPIGSEAGGNKNAGGNKKEYVATGLGRQVAENEMKRIGQISAIAAKIIGSGGELQ